MDSVDQKKRKRFSMKFKLVMNKMKFLEKYNSDNLEHNCYQNYLSSLKIVDHNIKQQLINFKINLEKAKVK